MSVYVGQGKRFFCGTSGRPRLKPWAGGRGNHPKCRRRKKKNKNGAASLWMLWTLFQWSFVRMY